MEIVFQTIQDLFKRLGLPLQQHMECTVHRLDFLHGDKPLQSPPFRTNYYAFLLIQSGKSRYTIDNQTFDLGKNAFYFTNPGHLKSFQIEELLTGYMLTFSETFVRDSYASDFFQQFPFLIHETTPVMYVDDATSRELAQVFEQMLAEYNGDSAYKKTILNHQLSILLYKTKELLQARQTAAQPNRRADEIVQEFKRLLNENIKNLALGTDSKVLSVKELAAGLNIHPNYLTNLVKQETGKSPSEWIQERISAEAQALLRNSTRTVSEIAYQLGFTDATHFGKFFRKRTGTSPTTFRQTAHL
jgi:AraC-like DNA-binding protein